MNRAETVTIIVASLLVGLIALGYFLTWWSLSTVLAEVPYFAIAGTIAVLAWGFRGRIERVLRPRGEGPPEKPVTEIDVTAPVRGGVVTSPGPYLIEPYRRRYVTLDIHRGERISGSLVEASGQEFNWFIVNRRNLVLANKNEEFTYVAGEAGAKGAAELRWRAPSDGPWFLLFDHAMRQYPREVHVDVRRT